MKALIPVVLLTFCPLTYGQILHQTIREDKTYEYWFSLDQYQKPLNYVIEMEQLGGNITKLKGNHKGHIGSGDIIISDLNGKPLCKEKLGNELRFEFATDQKEVVIEVLINGYAVYQKQTRIDNLTVLVLKLQPEPQDEVFQINSLVELTEIQLKEIMECTNSNKTAVNNCSKKGVYEVRLQ